MSTITKDLGVVTAYGYYKAGGGTMTEAEFTQFMVDFGTASKTATEAAQAALESENAAKASEETATQKSNEASQYASTASSKAEEAAQSASDASTANSDAVSAKTAAETAQSKAEDAQAAAEAVVDSIPSDYSQLSEDVSDLKEDFTAMNTATSEDVGKALKAKTVTNGKVTEWEFGNTGSGSGLTQSQKLAILNCFAHVAWTDAQGQTYYDELEDVLFPPAELTSISATYVNSNPVYTDTDIDTLKQYITVTAHYSDGTTSAVNAYTLSGTLTVGISVLTVAYSEMTTTISVTVSATPKSDMNGWADGVMYTDIEVVENSYYNNGTPTTYNNWDRTGKIPCDGASTLLFKANGMSAAIDKTYCWFFAQDESRLQKFDTSPLGDSDVSISVPSTAYYFGISGTRSQIAAQLTQGIYPYA